MCNVAVVGDNCVDCYTDAKGICYPGGNAVNVAVYLQRAGVPISYIGIIGNDKHGKYLRVCLKKEGVNLQYLKTMKGSTGTTLVELRNGERYFMWDEYGCQVPFRLRDRELNFLRKCRLVHFSAFTSWSGGAQNCQPALADELAKLTGGPMLALDFSDTAEGFALFMEIGHLLDYSFFSRDNIDKRRLQNFIEECLQITGGTVIVTMGAKGCIAGRRGRRNIFVPAEKCAVVDTLGAGDSFIAGFLSGILKDCPLRKSLEEGVRTATEVIQKQGAWENEATEKCNL